MERRNSERVLLREVFVRETNGNYVFTLKARDIAEEGIFLESKFKMGDQDYVSSLTFTLPNGEKIENVTGKMIREKVSPEKSGAVFQFVNMSESSRLALKLFILENQVA